MTEPRRKPPGGLPPSPLHRMYTAIAVLAERLTVLCDLMIEQEEQDD